MQRLVKMKNNHNGFSLIELILVAAIIGMLAAVSFPLLVKVREMEETGGTYSEIRNLSTLQARYFSRNNRFARLDELLADQAGLGTFANDSLTRGKYTFVMQPLHPSDDELGKKYKIIATRPVAGRQEPYFLEIDQTGVVKDPYKAEE